MDKGKYFIFRSKSAGVFAGILKYRANQMCVITGARRIWMWKGAASLSQLAMTGTSDPEGCKFPEPVKRVRLFEVIEILDVTPEAEKSIRSVPVWKQ